MGKSHVTVICVINIKNMKSIFLSPHQDDESLFGAFTLLREKPLVIFVTDSYIQEKRGDKITAEQRNDEAKEAMKILGCDCYFLGLRDDNFTGGAVKEYLKELIKFEKIYAPMPYPNGNPHHNKIGEAAKEILGDKVVFYSTYTKDNLYMTGDIEVVPTEEELELKNKALQCYKSQLSLPSTRPHFEAVFGKSEWLYA